MGRLFAPTVIYDGDTRWAKGQNQVITETQVRPTSMWDNKRIAVPACRLRVWTYFKEYGPFDEVSLMP